MRLDINYVVSLASQLMCASKNDHLDAVHRILRYIKGALGQGILYKIHGHVKAEAYTDVDCTGSNMDRKKL